MQRNYSDKAVLPYMFPKTFFDSFFLFYTMQRNKFKNYDIKLNSFQP